MRWLDGIIISMDMSLNFLEKQEIYRYAKKKVKNKRTYVNFREVVCLNF